MSGSIPVDLPKKVTGENLEEACIKAAKDMGYKIKLIDEVRKRYSLGSIQEHSDYIETNIRVGNLFPALRVNGVRKGTEQDRFYVWAGLPFGIASDAKVQK